MKTLTEITTSITNILLEEEEERVKKIKEYAMALSEILNILQHCNGYCYQILLMEKLSKNGSFNTETFKSNLKEAENSNIVGTYTHYNKKVIYIKANGWKFLTDKKRTSIEPKKISTTMLIKSIFLVKHVPLTFERTELKLKSTNDKELILNSKNKYETKYTCENLEIYSKYDINTIYFLNTEDDINLKRFKKVIQALKDENKEHTQIAIICRYNISPKELKAINKLTTNEVEESIFPIATKVVDVEDYFNGNKVSKN